VGEVSEAVDLFVIGAGSGGVACSRRAALHGACVAIAESRGVGGTCVLRGCVPKKLLVYASSCADHLRDAAGYGWQFPTAPGFDMARWQAAKARETGRLEGLYREMLADAGVALHDARATIEGRDEDGRLRIRLEPARGGEPRVVRAAKVVIATGAAPASGALPGLGHAATSDELLDLDHLPRTAAVIGGGYIGVEFAGVLARLGVAVSMHYRDSLPLRGFDPMLRSAGAADLAAAGVELCPGRVPEHLRPRGAEGGVALHFADERVRSFDFVLNATGRRPNTAGLGLEALGVALGAQGEVVVDAHLATAAAGLYAIGDVTNRKNLTPVAIAEGRALADALFGPAAAPPVDLSLVASAVFTQPPLATVGATEPECAAGPAATDVYETDFRPMQQAFIGGRGRTRMKLLADTATGRVRGLHMAGADAPEIVQSLAVALTAGATKAQFDRTVAVHPTAAEEFVLMRKPARRVGG
jgi:glutathione reductase (NADPH)